ncbi:ribosome biogenesis protein BMS1 homolog [Oppia nitens]|uniref:ribosome biogenesis protein BMS1 homolog n=1 Tax=Oppia nitens TaxID=1686743 RepID=UPI0023DAF711|nr:ribosome biogenesis protein BMS1 homolog [Oppia nitens]
MDKEDKHKSHQKRQSGRKADKKKLNANNANNSDTNVTNSQKKNSKAFAIKSAVKAERQFRRKQDLTAKREQLPTVDRTPLEPPPFVVAVVGPQKVGKSTLISSILKNLSRSKLSQMVGPITCVAGKKRRLTLIECNNDINCMIDVAKVADLVLLMVDASFGFEMETFEFLNICQSHGFPRIMGVLTHLDVFKNPKSLRKTKKILKHRFWTEIYSGAKLFYLSGLIGGHYLKNEIHNLCRFISVIKFRPLQWITSHPYLIVDRIEDITNQELIRQNPKCNRKVCLFGYSRGSNFKRNNDIHIPGCGDFTIKDISFLSDPCPLPDKEKRRSLNEKERLIYAPMSGVGGLVYDKDAIYIDLGGSHSHKDKTDEHKEHDDEMVSSIISSKQTIDEKMASTQLQLFSNTVPSLASNVFSNERFRRKVTFNTELNLDEYEDEANDDYSDEDNESENEQQMDLQNEDSEDDINEEISDSDEVIEDEDELNVSKWKNDLSSKAANAFYSRLERTENIQKLVYGDTNDLKDDNYFNDYKELSDGLFKVIEKKHEEMHKMKATLNSIECTKFPKELLINWNSDRVFDTIKDCFVTGKWADNEDAAKLLAIDTDQTIEEKSDDEVFGDFEDLETGEKFFGNVEENNEKDKNDGNNDSDNEMQKLMEKKRKTKERFDLEYDEKDGNEEKSFLEVQREKLQEQSRLNRSEFENMNDEQRIQFEGFRAGMYLRLEIDNIPHQLIDNFDPNHPLIVGGLLSGETNIGYVRVRIKKHRWYDKILKSRDPLIMSMGWRRFQTQPLYSTQDDNGRNRLLKYTPQHMHCYASFWGPISPQNTGFIAVQSVSDIIPNFRIAATGVVLDIDKSSQIVKKLKLLGTALKIYKKTAFIKGMFNTALEVTKFEGASLRTVSGIRGQIKKAIRAPPGAFRATFEDKILMSDIVFLKTWYTVTVPKFYAIVTSLLLPLNEKLKWQGMKTVGQLRYESGIQAPNNRDSHYTPIERKKFNFKPLTISKSLQRELPFKAKPKLLPKKQNKVKRVAVVRDREEQQTHNLMKMIRAAHRQKMMKEKQAMAQRVAKHKKEMNKIQKGRENKQKETKKRIFSKLSKKKTKENN